MSYESYQVQPLDLSVKSADRSDSDYDISDKHKSLVFHHHAHSRHAAAAAALMAVSGSGGGHMRRMSESSDCGSPDLDASELRDSESAELRESASAELRAGPRKRYLSKFLNSSSGKIFISVKITLKWSLYSVYKIWRYTGLPRVNYNVYCPAIVNLVYVLAYHWLFLL